MAISRHNLPPILPGDEANLCYTSVYFGGAPNSEVDNISQCVDGLTIFTNMYRWRRILRCWDR